MVLRALFEVSLIVSRFDASYSCFRNPQLCICDILSPVQYRRAS